MTTAGRRATIQPPSLGGSTLRSPLAGFLLTLLAGCVPSALPAATPAPAQPPAATATTAPAPSPTVAQPTVAPQPSPTPAPPAAIPIPPAPTAVPTPDTPTPAKVGCQSVGRLPDPQCTPGALAETDAGVVCNRSTRLVRPPVSYTDNLKVQQISQYGYGDTNPTHYEEDHLIPLELGGSPTDPRNLWPEPYPLAYDKGKV